MRGNAWQTTAIISITLVVLLIVPIVIMGRGWQEMNDRMKSAENNQKETATKASRLEGELKTLKEIVGKAEAPTDEVKKLFEDDMTHVLPGENAATRSYHDAVQQLDNDLKKERNEHQSAKEQLAQIESDYKNAKKLHEAINSQKQQELDAAEKDRDEAKASFEKTIKQNQEKLTALQTSQADSLARANKAANDANKEAAKQEREKENVMATNTALAEQMDDIRNPNVEYPAGKIISVDQRSGLCVVNVGSADGLLVRTMFSVYDAQITGLSFASTITGRKDSIYCDVCKREIALSTSKASVEVMRLLGPHRAEVRILDDVLTDPIVVGDVVYSPIWKPGQKQRFALMSNMVLPGVDKQSGYEMLKRLIESNGGVIDCWLDETSGLPADKIIQGSISTLTTYVVVNDDSSKDLEPEVGNAEKVMLERAKNFAVRKIGLQDLLSRMGWKNVTPEYDFGKQIFTKEMRVKQGEPRLSQGKISDLFTPDNTKARITPADIPSRLSQGKVSDVFSGSPPAVRPSQGSTSELFRARKPATATGE